MNVNTIHGIARINGNGIAYPNAHKWTGHFVIEGPVLIGASVGKPAFDLFGFEI
jgi:hypothetical protein